MSEELTECPNCGADRGADYFDRVAHAGLGITVGYACPDCKTLFPTGKYSTDRSLCLSDNQTTLGNRNS